MNPIKQVVRALGNSYIRHILVQEYKTQQSDPRGPNERPLEYSFALSALSLCRYQAILDVGAGLSAWRTLLMGCGYQVTAVDKVSGYWAREILNHHVHIIRDDIAETRIKGPFGIITCLSTLEHIREHSRAMSSMASLLKARGSPDPVLPL